VNKVVRQAFGGRFLRMWSRSFVALRTRNYRLYFSVQCVSNIGTWVQAIGESWLVVRLTHSSLALGITAALQFTPLLLLGSYGGVLVDRLNKRRLLLFTQSFTGLLALTIGLLTVTGVVRVWMVWLAALLLGVVTSLDNPARQAFTREMVGKKEITNAIGLNNALSAIGRTMGPAVGGAIIAATDAGWCFLINAASFFLVAVMLTAVRTGELHSLPRVARTRGQVREGLRHIWQTPSLRAVLVTLTIGGVFGTNFEVLFPLFASRTFGQGPAVFGLLMGIVGVGSMVGSLIIAATGAATVRRVALYTLTFGLSLAAVGAAPTLGTALAAVALMGVGFGMFTPSCGAVFQLNVADAMFGRIMALFTVAVLGSIAIGGPAIGGVAQLLGPRAGFLVGAAGCIAAAPIGLLVGIRRRSEHTGAVGMG
jgi:MFS family permease